MSKSRIYSLLAVILAVSAILIFFCKRGEKSSSANLQVETSSASFKSNLAQYENNDGKRKNSRSTVLISFQHRWKTLSSSKHDYSDEHKAFAVEAAKEFMASDEWVKLLLFVKESKSLSMETLMLEEMQKVFKSENSSVARLNLLAAILSESDNYILQQLCCFAVENCEESEFQEFIASISELPDKSYVVTSKLSNLSNLSSHEPEYAVSQLKQMTGEIAESSIYSPLIEDIITKLPDSANFEKMATSLLVPPLKNSNPILKDIYENISISFFSRWASINPAEAANYVLGSTEKFGDSELNAIVGVVAKQDLNTAADWVKLFPPGRIYDGVASHLVDYLAGYGELAKAENIIQGIENDKLKQQVIENLNVLKARNDRISTDINQKK